MKLIKVAAAVLNQTPLDWTGNASRIRAALAEARRQGASVVCLPELCLTGYGCEDAFHAPGVARRAWELLHELAADTRGLIVSIGLPVQHLRAVYNMAALIVDGRIVGFAAKRHLAGDGVHYEPRWFKAWPAGKTALLTDDSGRAYMAGDLVFDAGGVRIGFEICEDAWAADRPGISLSRRGVDVILNPSASHFAFGKNAVRQKFILEGSRAFNAAYVYANLLGNESGRVIFDGEAMIASGGKLAATIERFSYQDFGVISAQVDLDHGLVSQSRNFSAVPDLEGMDAACLTAPFDWPALDPEPAGRAAEPWEAAPDLKLEEFSRAVPLALFDYLRKSRSRGFVVSLSGGADSTSLVVLIRLMIELGTEELGLEGFQKKLAWHAEVQKATDLASLTRALLTTAYQASGNSGGVTRDAAKGVAEAIGAHHMEFDISGLVAGYTAMVEGGIGRALTWERDDVTLQNIQARVRSPGIWMVANLQGALLLSTSNRSEAAVGYATMDGDTSGGLSPISGIDKAWLREWLRWMEHHGPAERHPLPVLGLVNVQAPTAELRPPGSHQTDESDLMPYPLLDAIERAAIRDKYMPLEVLRQMRLRFPQYGLPQLSGWVERFFQLWCRNQWKRERYAPGFHLDDENLDPKTWCRFPILSSGFEVELAEMRTWTRENS
ncbi:MAG: synthetase [Verrucomicrobiales bacterium]|nr:synthetase [Verrucomicrobiales bacterium]